MTRTEEEQKVADTKFDKHRDDLLKRDLSNTENYDKAILTLSSSCLALSLTAIKFVVPIVTASYIIILKSAWALLAFSVICSLSAYLVSNKAMGVQLDNARDYYKKGIEDAFSRKNRFESFNWFLNLVTGITFAIAICLIVTFITINIETGEAAMSDKKSTGTPCVKSANIPSMEEVDLRESANVPAMERVNTTSGNVVNSANAPMEQAPSATTTSESGSSSGDK